MKRILLTIIIILLGGGMLAAEARIFYVSTSGNNGNPGTINNPWHTISYATGSSSGVAAGDTVMVRAGNYPEAVSPGVSGTAAEPIVVMAYPGETVSLNPGRFRFSDGINYWKIDGFHILNSDDNGIYAPNGTHAVGFLTVSNCEISHHLENGVCFIGPDWGGATIEDCIIEWNGTEYGAEGTGICMYGGTGKIWAHRNWIASNWAKGISHATSAAWNADSSVIDSNYIINSYESGIDWWGDNSYIMYNYLSENGCRDPELNEYGDKGLALDTNATGNMVAFNIIKSSGRNELDPRGGYNKYYNNIFIKDHYYTAGSQPSTYAAAIIFWGGNHPGNEFRNNIIVNTRSEDDHHWAIICESYLRYTEQIWSNNLYWTPNATLPYPKSFKLYGAPGSTYWNLDEIQDQWPDQEIGSIDDDPGFESLQDSIFTLLYDSPARNAGVYVGFPYQGIAPDIGRYEYDEGNTPPWIYPEIENFITDEDLQFLYDLHPHENDNEQTGAELIWSASGLNTSLAIASVNPTTDLLTISPVANAYGEGNLTLTLTDGMGGYADTTLTLTILPVNDPPWIEPVVADFNTDEDTQLSYDLTPHENDYDHGHNELTWGFSGLSPSLATASLNAATDVITIVPQPNQFGTDDFMLFLTDGGGLQDSQSVTLTIDPIDDPPEINPEVEEGAGKEDVVYGFDLTRFENDLEDTLTGLYWTVTGANPDLINSITIDLITDSLTASFMQNESGEDTLLLTLHDSGGNTDTQDWILTVAAINDTPWISPQIPQQNLLSYSPYTFELLDYGHDIEDPPQELTWAVEEVNPSIFSMSINPATQVLTVTPVLGASGFDNVKILLTDRDDATVEQYVMFSLFGGVPPEGPSIGGLPDFFQPSGFNPEPLTLEDYVEVGTIQFNQLTLETTVWDPVQPGGNPEITVYIDQGILYIETPSQDWEGIRLIEVKVEDTYGLFDTDTLQVSYSHVQWEGEPLTQTESVGNWDIIENDQTVHQDEFLVHITNFSPESDFVTFQKKGGQIIEWLDTPETTTFVFPLVPNDTNSLQLRILYSENQYGNVRNINIIEDSTPPSPPAGLEVKQEDIEPAEAQTGSD